jgi:hypothetical protein
MAAAQATAATTHASIVDFLMAALANQNDYNKHKADLGSLL